MRNNWWKNRKKDAGNAMVELAIAAPMLLLMLLGATDFGRVFYHAVTVANAAGTGAFYGAQNNIKSGHYDEMAQKAKEDAKDLGSAVTATGERYCDCPNGTRVDCVTGFCAGYGFPRVYVRTQVQETFSTIVKYPRVPDSILVGRKAYMRAQ